MDFSQKCQLFRVCANEKCQLKKQGTSKSPLHSCGFCHFSIVLVDHDLVEVIVYDAVCLAALAVKGFLVYVFVYIWCTPAAHFHGILLWYIQHGSCTCEDMSAIMKANILNTVVSEQSLESLSDGIGFDRNNVVCLFLVWDCLN